MNDRNPATRLVFLDTETTGLDPARHQVWEAAWAFEGGGVFGCFLSHTLDGADPKALELNGYHQRFNPKRVWESDEDHLRASVKGATLVCSNPSFDTAMLRARWGVEPWHHRKIDIATYAMPALGSDRPVGLAQIAKALGVEQPDHSATQDVLTLRECYQRLCDVYACSTITPWSVESARTSR